MLSCEIKVNGSMVGHIYARNITGSLYSERSAHEYMWEYYRPEQRKVISGTCTHVRKAGIEKLVSIILSEVDK